MKITLIKISLLLMAFILTGCKEQAQDIGSGRSFSCAEHNNAISCWGYNLTEGLVTGDFKFTSLLTKRTFTDPQLAVGGYHYCVLDEGEVQCFLNNEHQQTEVPQLTNPYEIASGGNYTCALDDSGLVCWGEVPYLDEMPESLENPRKLVAGLGHICLIDDNGTQCGGFSWTGDGSVNPPESFGSPTLLTSSPFSLYTCGFQDRWLCWGGGYTYELPESLAGADSTVPGYLQACSITDGIIGCWGDGSFGPLKADVPANITNPKKVSVGMFNACTIADEGVVCWGEDLDSDDPMIRPPFYL